MKLHKLSIFEADCVHFKDSFFNEIENDGVKLFKYALYLGSTKVAQFDDLNKSNILNSCKKCIK